jgi:pSer/pThr/pTyr-binding forkhead associated (FHA) protein
VISDLQSRNGTFVNGARVAGATLAHGDEVTVGRSRLVVYFSNPDEATVADEG